MEGAVTDSPDFLLSASIFHQQASSLFSQPSPLSAYFSSLWLQELPEDKRGSLKRISTNICPHCGTRRISDNFRVRIKSRKRCSRRVSRILSKKSKSTGQQGNISEELEQFQQSKNCISYRCEVCKKAFTQPGISRSTQKEVKAEAGEVVRVTVNTPRAKAASFVSDKLPATPSVKPSSSQKRRAKDSNAGLTIPFSISSFKTALFSPARNSEKSNSQFSKSLLDKFLL